MQVNSSHYSYYSHYSHADGFFTLFTSFILFTLCRFSEFFTFFTFSELFTLFPSRWILLNSLPSHHTHPWNYSCVHYQTQFNTNLCSRARSWIQGHCKEGEESPAAHPGGCSDFCAAHHCPAVHGEAEESPWSVEERWGLELWLKPISELLRLMKSLFYNYSLRIFMLKEEGEKESLGKNLILIMEFIFFHRKWCFRADTGEL